MIFKQLVFHIKRRKLDIQLIPYAKINQKWISTQKISSKITKQEKKIFMILDLARDPHIWYQKHRQQNKKVNWTPPKLKTVLL
jgi:hypothetical protein